MRRRTRTSGSRLIRLDPAGGSSRVRPGVETLLLGSRLEAESRGSSLTETDPSTGSSLTANEEGF